jgi:hypothetical protein
MGIANFETEGYDQWVDDVIKQREQEEFELLSGVNLNEKEEMR